MKIKTTEQLAAEIAIHKKTGATSKVKLLEEQLLNLGTPVDAVKDTQEKQGVIATAENKIEASGGAPVFDPQKVYEEVEKVKAGMTANPLGKIEADHDKEMADAKDEMAKALNEMHESGMTWKEVAETTGEKNAYNKVKAWKKRQQQT